MCKREIALPWVSFGSDAASPAPEGVFLKSSTTRAPTATSRASSAKYVRDEKVATLPDAIRRLTSLPATQPRHQAARLR